MEIEFLLFSYIDTAERRKRLSIDVISLLHKKASGEVVGVYLLVSLTADTVIIINTSWTQVLKVHS